METEEILEQWLKANLILLHKKGDQKNLNNYWPIGKVSNTSKSYIKIMKERMVDKLNFNQSRKQVDFRKIRSTDHLFVITQALEKAREYNMYLNLLFIDYNKAFDLIRHKAMWRLWACPDEKVPVHFSDLSLIKIFKP